MGLMEVREVVEPPLKGSDPGDLEQCCKSSLFIKKTLTRNFLNM